MLNKANILKVADAIEQHAIPDLGFNLGAWIEPSGRPEDDKTGHGCGTVACIAGWAAAVKYREEGGSYLDLIHQEIRPMAEEYLGIDNWQLSHLLFTPTLNVIYDKVGPERAVSVLRHLAKTGDVVW